MDEIHVFKHLPIEKKELGTFRLSIVATNYKVPMEQ
jgi:hypothetical protein